MYKRIDVVEDEFEGFSYENISGVMEYVDNDPSGIVKITDSAGDNVAIYGDDVEKLIKALQAIQTYRGK